MRRRSNEATADIHRVLSTLHAPIFASQVIGGAAILYISLFYFFGYTKAFGVAAGMVTMMVGEESSRNFPVLQ